MENNGKIREDLLVAGLFKDKEEFKSLEDVISAVIKSNEIPLDKVITVSSLTSQDNIKDNHTWDCILSGDEASVGISIKANNSKTTKHPQYKAVIKHVFRGTDKEETYIKAFEKLEIKIAEELLEINPLAKTLMDIRKDKNNVTINSIDRMLANRYQTFFWGIFEKGLNSVESVNLLRFCLSSKEYIKVIWNNNHNFIVEDYLKLKEIVESKFIKTVFNENNKNIVFYFEGGLILSMRFKISFYKKHLTGYAVKCEINILNSHDKVNKIKVKK